MRNGGTGRGRNGHAGNGGDPGTIRCAVYTRKSTDEGLDRDFNSLDAQREAAEAYIKSQAGSGWIVLPDRYDDGGFSGGTLERPALKRLLADIKSGKVDRIVVYKIDRLSRSLLDFARLAEVFEQNGVGIVSVTQQLDTSTSMGRLTMNMLLSFAQFEREMVSDRTRDKLRAARRKGKFVGGGLILGYDRHPDGGKLVVNEVEAERVREIFRLFLEVGTIIAVVEELKRRNWTLKRWTTKDDRQYGGGSFDKFSLKRLLTNHAYIGEVAFDGAIYPGEHEAILDRKTWDAVQAILADRRREVARTGRPSTALLGGILRCSACDAAMSPTYSQRGNRRYRYYLCQRAGRNGWASCPTKNVPAAEIERFVIDRIHAIGSDPALIDATVEAARQQLAARRRELEAETRTLRDQIDQAHSDLRKQMIGLSRSSLGRPRPAQPEQQEGIRALEDRLTATQAELAGLRRQRIDPADLQAVLAAWDGVWANLTSHERARVVGLLIERIDYHGGTGSLKITFAPAGIRTLAAEARS